METVTDSLSFNQVVQYIESHTLVAIIAVVLIIAALVILVKIARWVLRPIVKGALAGGLVFAGLYFLSFKEVWVLSPKWIILIAVLLFLLTAVLDLNRKK